MDYKAAGRTAGKDTGKDTGKDAISINRLDLYVLKLLKVVGNKALTVKEMMDMLDLKGSDNFRKKYLNPAIKNGYMKLLYPDKPKKRSSLLSNGNGSGFAGKRAMI